MKQIIKLIKKKKVEPTLTELKKRSCSFPIFI